MIKIGKLAKQTGLTVRALRYYDEIGILKPSERSSAGYRLYTQADLVRLQEIKLLQKLNFSLQDIISLLNKSSTSFSSVVKMHHQKVTEQIQQQKALLTRLDKLQRVMRDGGEAQSYETLVETVGMIVMFEKYYTPEQLETLAKQEEELGPEKIAHAQQQWELLMKEFKKYQQANEPVESCPVQALAQEANKLIQSFTRGDPEMQKSLKKMYASKDGVDVAIQGTQGFERELFDYINQAIECMNSVK